MARTYRKKTNATRDGEKEGGLLVPGLFVIGAETVRLRPDQEGLGFDGCLGHSAPVHCPLCGPKSFCHQHALSDLGNATRDFMGKTPGYLGIRLPTRANIMSPYVGMVRQLGAMGRPLCLPLLWASRSNAGIGGHVLGRLFIVSPCDPKTTKVRAQGA